MLLSCTYTRPSPESRVPSPSWSGGDATGFLVLYRTVPVVVGRPLPRAPPRRPPAVEQRALRINVCRRWTPIDVVAPTTHAAPSRDSVWDSRRRAVCRRVHIAATSSIGTVEDMPIGRRRFHRPTVGRVMGDGRGLTIIRVPPSIQCCTAALKKTRPVGACMGDRDASSCRPTEDLTNRTASELNQIFVASTVSQSVSQCTVQRQFTTALPDVRVSIRASRSSIYTATSVAAVKALRWSSACGWLLHCDSRREPTWRACSQRKSTVSNSSQRRCV